jgi:hypothetical protein
MTHHLRICLIILGLAPGFLTPPSRDVGFTKVVLDTTFRSEGVTVADVNRDGKVDVLAGNFWYQAPNWTPHEIAPPMSFDAAKGYSNSFVNFTADVNRDGWPDQILIDTPGTVPVLWRENPRSMKGPWPTHTIARNACNESPTFSRLSGAGNQPVLIFALDDEQMVWLEPSSDPTGEFTIHAISERIPKDAANRHRGAYRYSHGLGVGDLNGDGRDDVVIRSGYWEAPKDPRSGLWRFVAANLGDECAQMQVYDVNGDGLNDVITSSAHGIGVWWFEQSRDSRGAQQFSKHLIDDSFSQTHSLELADINGDGLKDIVTGKRFWAHGPTGDVDPSGPAIVCWYELKRDRGSKMAAWTKHVIDADSGVGTQFVVADLNKDRRPDVITANKKGVFIFLQR